MLIEYLDAGSISLLCVLTFVVGACIASFVNCWAWRASHGISVMHGRSRCLSCEHELKAIDLIPIISWLMLRGKCRYCGAKISVSCIVTEILLGVAFVAIVLVYGFSVETIELLCFASALMFLSLYDIESFKIPNACIVVILAIRIIYMVYAVLSNNMQLSDVGYYVLSAVGTGIIFLIIIIIMDAILKRESMGGGDLKLFVAAALFFGAVQMVFLVILSCIIGLIVIIASGSFKKAKINETTDKGEKSRPIPFGPSISIACILTMLIGTPFVNWYLGMLL